MFNALNSVRKIKPSMNIKKCVYVESRLADITEARIHNGYMVRYILYPNYCARTLFPEDQHVTSIKYTIFSCNSATV